MTAVARRHRVTEEEFLSLPESHDHVELIDGELILTPAPLPRHQTLLKELTFRFELWSRRRGGPYVGQSPFDIRLGPERIVQPDLFVLLGGRPALDKLCTDVPELVVEILSSNASYDRMTKRLLYAQAGVLEYWIVDPLDRTVEVVRGLTTVSVERERVSSAVCQGLDLDLTEVFAVLD